MKKSILSIGGSLLACGFLSAQVNYTVTVTRLKSTADPCDGGTPPFCVSAPQDPVFNIWSMDGGGNENTYCWVFDGDPEIEYNLWKDIQNVEIANENNVNTNFIDIDMAGHEGDAVWAPSCTPDTGDDQIQDRQFVYQFDLTSIPQGTPYTQVVDLADLYYAELEITWVDLTSSVSEQEFSKFIQIYPNPNNGTFTVNKLVDKGGKLEIIDLNGRKVYDKKLDLMQEEITIGQEKGYYLIRYTTEDQLFHSTILVD